MADTATKPENENEEIEDLEEEPPDQGTEPVSEDTPEVHPEENKAVEGHEPSPTGPIQADESAQLAGSSGDIGLKDDALIKELRAAEEHANNTAALVEVLKEAIADLSKKENLTEEDASMLQLKQNELMKKLAELEQVTKHIQNLVGLQQISSSILGPPLQCREFSNMDPCQAVKELKTPNLPKVIICGNESTNQIPKIIVCDPIESSDSKNPVYQQIPGGPLTVSNTGEQPLTPCVDRAATPCLDRGTTPCTDRPLITADQTPGGGLQQLGPVHQQFRMTSPGQFGQQFAGTMPAPIRQVPGLMGQPPTMMSLPQTFMGQTMEIMSGQQGWSPGNIMGPQQKQPPMPFTGVLGGMGPYEPYKPGPQDFNQRPPQEIRKGLSDASAEEMKKQLASLQDQMKKITAENEELKLKLTTGITPGKIPEKPLCKMTLGKVPVCKLDIYNQMGLPLPRPNAQENMATFVSPGKCKEMMSTGQCKLDLYRGMGIPPPGFGVGGDASSKDVETMVTSMEEEVRAIQKELDGVQAERRSLELQKKVLQCVGPLIGQDSKSEVPVQVAAGSPSQGTALSPILVGGGGGGGGPGLQSELQYRELVEKYNKLQENYNLKVEEIALLRVELDGSRRESRLSIEKTRDAEARVDDLLERLRSAEAAEKKTMAMRDQIMELEQQLVLAKQRYREASEEVEGLKTELNDLKTQADEYREKYMKAQQTVEEQKNQLDMKNLEATRYQEQLMLEFQRTKSHFQSKLEELTPYPEMLKKIQNKLREAINLKALAEKHCLTMSRNLETANEEREKLRKTLDEINKNKVATEAEKASLQGNLTDGEKKMEETKAENSRLKAANVRLEEAALKAERKYEEKVHEVLQLQSQLETLREESARQVARTKDYCENVRKNLLAEISELEKQVAAAKAAAKLAQQDRDLIRQKMQAQITHLNDNFEQAQMRIRNLQSHVNYLKSSFTNMIAPVDVSIDKILGDDNT